MKYKQTSYAQFIYLVNQILIPKVEYIAKVTNFSRKSWEILFRPILGLIKNKLGVSSKIATGALIHEGLINLRTLWQRSFESQISDFIIRINESKNVDHDTSMIRLIDAQLKLNSPISLLRDEISLSFKHNEKNLQLEILATMKQLGMGFETPNIEIEREIERNDKPFLREILDKSTDKFLMIPKYWSLFVLNQICNYKGDELLPWNMIKELYRGDKSKKGSIHKWYLKIREAVTITGSYKFKDEYKIDSKKVQTARPYLPKISNKLNKKEWVQWYEDTELKVGKIIQKTSVYATVEEAVVVTDHKGNFWIEREEIRPATKKIKKEGLRSIPLINMEVQGQFRNIIKIPLNNVMIGDNIVHKTEVKALKEKEYVEIPIESFEAHFINKWIDDSKLKDDLKMLLEKLQQKDTKEFNFFTDGSLQEEGNKKKMGAALLETGMGLNLKAKS